MRESKEPNIRVTPAPAQKPSTMPMEHRLFLRALQGLRGGEAIRLRCDDSEDASLLAKAVGSFIRRERKNDRLNHHFSVLNRKVSRSSVIYVINREET